MKKRKMINLGVLMLLLTGCMSSKTDASAGEEEINNIWTREVEDTNVPYVSTLSVSSNLDSNEDPSIEFEEIISSTEVYMYDSNGRGTAIEAGEFVPSNMHTKGEMTFITYIKEDSEEYNDFIETNSIENFTGSPIFGWSENERTLLVDSHNNKVYSLEDLFEFVGKNEKLIFDSEDVKNINTYIFGSTIYFYNSDNIYSIVVEPNGLNITRLLNVSEDLSSEVVSILELVANENQDILFKVDTGYQEQIVFFNRKEQTGHIVNSEARNTILIQGKKEAMYLSSEGDYLSLYNVSSSNENDSKRKVWSTLDREELFNNNLGSMTLKTFEDRSILVSVRASSSTFITLMHDDQSVQGGEVVIIEKNVVLDRSENLSYEIKDFDINKEGNLFVLYDKNDILNHTHTVMYNIYDLERGFSNVLDNVKTFAINVNDYAELVVLSETVFKTLRIDAFDVNGKKLSDSRYEYINNKLNIFINHIGG